MVRWSGWMHSLSDYLFSFATIHMFEYEMISLLLADDVRSSFSGDQFKGSQINNILNPSEKHILWTFSFESPSRSLNSSQKLTSIFRAKQMM